MCDFCDKAVERFGAGSWAASATRDYMHAKTLTQRTAYENAAADLAEYLVSCEERDNGDDR